MQLAQVLDIFEQLLAASRHPEIVAIDRYGRDTAPGGQSPAGVRVTYPSGATGMLWGATYPGEIAIPVPDEMPPPKLRAPRIAIFAVQLLDVARPAAFRSWQLVALPDLGPTDQRGKAASGVSIVCTDGTKVLLRATATGGYIPDPDVEPFPDYRIPEGVKTWQQAGAVSADR